MRIMRHSWEEFVPPTERCVYCGLLKVKTLNPVWHRHPQSPKYFVKYHTEIDGQLKEGRRATEFHCNSNRNKD
jgi:hypothetical protein